MPKEYGGLHYEDGRWMYVLKKCWNCLNLKLDTWGRFIQQEANQVMLTEFFDKPDAMSLIFYVDGGNMFGSDKWPKKLPNKGLLIGRISPGKVEASAAKCGENLWYGEVPGNAIEYTSAFIEEVILGLLTSPKIIAKWPDVVTEDVKKQALKIKNRVFIITGQMTGKTLLALPPGIDQCEINKKFDVSKNRNLIHTVESAIVDWSALVRDVLKEDASKALGKYPTPENEVQFWLKRYKNLDFINQQLQQKQIKKMATLLNHVGSTYYTALQELISKVTISLEEALDIKAHLNPICGLIGEIEQRSLVETIPCLKALYVNVSLIWRNSKFFNTPTRIVILLREVSNLIIEHVSGSLGSEDVLSQDPEDFYPKMDEAFTVCKTLKSRFNDFKTELNTLIEEEDLGLKPVTVPAFMVFDRMDRFMKRMTKVKTFFHTTLEFMKLEKVVVGGLRGRFLTTKTEEIFKKFQAIIGKFNDKPYDPLNPDDPGFDNDFAKLNADIGDLEQQLSTIVCKGFEDCSDLESAIKLTQIWGTLLDRPIIKQDFDHNFIKILDLYSKDLDDVKVIFDKHVREYHNQRDGYRNPQRLLIYKNNPPVSGELRACKHIRDRITWPIEHFEHLNHPVIMGEPWEIAMAKKEELEKMILEFEESIFQLWAADVDQTCEFNLSQTLLTRDRATMFIETNFSPKLVAVLCEVKYLTKLGRTELPALAEKLYSRNETYMRFVGNLNLLVEAYNATRKSLLKVEYPLVADQIAKIDQVLVVAEDYLNWEEDGLGEPMLTGAALLAAEEEARKAAEAAKLEEMLSMAGSKITTMDSDSEEVEGEEGEVDEEEKEEVEEDGMWNYDPAKDKTNYQKSDTWEYIEGVRDTIMDLHFRVDSTHENIDRIQALMDEWAKTPLFERKQQSITSNLLDLDGRKDRVTKKYGIIKQDGIKIHAYVAENAKFFRADVDSDIWKAYKVHVDQIVVKGFHQCLRSSIMYLMDNTEPHVQPLFTANLELDIPEMVFNPSLDPKAEVGFRATLKELFNDIYHMSTQVERISENTDRVHYLADMESLASLVELKSKLWEQMKAALHAAYDYSQEFMIYSNLWLDDRKELLKQFLTYGRLLTMEDLENAAYGLEEQKPTLEAFRKQMDSYEDLHETIGNYPLTETFNGWFLVHIKPFIKGLQKTVREWGSMFKEHLINHVRDSLMGLQDFIIKTDAVLSAKLVKGDYDGLVQAIESLAAFNERQEATDVMFEPLKHTIDLLKTYKYEMSEEILKLLAELPERWAYVKKLAVVARQVVTPLEANEMSIIRRKCGTFDQKQLAFREKFRNEAIFKLECGSPYRRLDVLYRKIMKLFKEQAEIEESAAIFGVDVPEYRQLQMCRRETAMCKQVWDLANLIMSSTNDWNYTLWKDINVDEMDTSLKAFAKDIRGLDKETRSWPIYLSLDDLCKNLMVSLKAIGDLQNPAIRERHWQQLQIATKVEFEMTEETTLEDLLKLHLHKFEEDVNEIVDKAVKEMAMEKTMKELNATWKNMRFDYTDHPRTGLPLIVCSEELMDTLEDNQVQVQGLMNSKFVGFFLDEVSYWAATLACADAVLAVWLDVQRTWAHLESIFIASEDIRKQLPEDAARFDELDRDFKEILKDASKTPIVTEATGKEGLQETLDGIKEKLVMCEKSLAEYLETKRLAFPRFYFISSSDLLDILSNGNNPREVAKHLSKLFDNMVNMRFQGTGKTADAMYSSEGEEVPFSDPILCDGQVEAWLSKLLEQMRLTIRCALSDAVMGYEEKPRDQWLFDYPAQACLTATQIWWATEVGIAFSKLEEGYENALKDYYKKQVQQLNTLIGHLCGYLNKQNRQSIMTVCTMDVHARDVVGKLILLKIESSNEFVWQSQLRHRWDDFKRHCFANICDAQFRYSYEYLGNCPRLVITPLTDRCYITQTQSLHLIMGAAPAGPAGTGKTETTKDLARTLAIMIYVFNCSEQMDYKSVGNIFKGLSQTGAWGCFDEFNRITVEVLSVVAVQVKSIQEAIKYKKKRFIFQGEEISLTPTIGVFITMNPGYAGRTELPENLKALFRPCAMVVPDFELICEIMLVAEGFTEARILARKFLTLYTLCKQLLSKQDHYDWGLRAIKSVLVVAGALKRGDKDRPEDQVLMRALRDFNIPKIVTDDMPVFMGLIGDLFPGVNVPRKLDLELEADCKQAVIDLNLQPEDSFVLKLVQLDELLYVRHSVFVIGQAGSGKTQVLRGLFRAYYNRGTKPVWQDLNPKAVTNDELFGIINPATREWKDGLFSTIMRDLSVIPGDGAKWIVLDGDIDPMWIESLNTVMDDNKILTLASNERIPVTPPMRLLFEISNLRTATPATVSRAGILFINPADLGWNPVVLSWLSKRSSPAERANLSIFFDKYIPPTLEIFKTKFLTITPVMECAKIQMLLDLLDCLLVPSNIPNDSGKEIYELYFVFSCIWSFGGALFQDQLVDHRAEFSKWWIGEFKTIKFPPGGVVFDFFIDHESHKFVHWAMDVPKFELDPDLPLQACMVPTSETRRIRFFMDVLMEKSIPVMLVGNAGAGKTVLVQSKLRALDDRFMVQNVPFNFYTTSAVLQGVLEKPLEKKAGRNYGPPGTKRMVYFIDDMNMPEVDLYGTVEPHTLIRQHMDYKHWYDRVKLSLKEIHNVQYVSCMNPTAGSFTINPRLQRHFCVFAVSFPGKEATTTIYKNILVQHFNINSFPRAVKQQAATIVAASIALHEKITSTFLPTAVKFHYVFNLRDLSNLFQGLLFSSAECIRNANDIVRMWMHEVSRVYGDKMINTEDVDEFLKIRDFFAGQFFESIPENILLKHPLLFCHFSKGIGEIKYGPVHEWKDLNKLLVGALDSYNEWNAQMNLVLFEDAMAHVIRINRILESPRGNALLVGVGGSGKQSLSRLAAFISALEVFQITLRKGYGMADLKADINNLYMRAGIKNIGIMFLLTDAQVGDELFLVLVNDLLASGEIPDLFGDDEIDNIINGVRPGVKAAGIEDSSANCWKFFIDRVRKQLKTVLCFSPVGSTLRIRGRKFPALVNCTQIDWFLEWPDEALQSVALTFLKEIKNIDEEVKPSVAEFMAHVHQTVNASSDLYRQNERRYNYTTPKSYLEQIFLYQNLMKIKGGELDAKTERLENGIMKLEDTSGKVDDLKDKLKHQEVELKAKNEAADKLIEVVGVETAKVTKEKEFADEEEAKVSVIAVEVGQKQSDCERDLEKAEPALLAAVEALNTLNKNNLTELKSFGSPPAAVVQVTAAVMCLLSTNGKVPKDRSWKACKVMMAKVDAFLDQLINYDKENIHKNCLKEVRPYLANPEFNPDFIRAKSGAAAGLCSWVINIVIFYEVFCDVEPKRNALAQANADLKAAKDKLDVIKNKLRELDENLAELTAKYEEAIGEKLKCQQEAEATELTINLANRLVGGLSSENVRWRKAVAEFKDQANRLSGDVLMITAFISYVGYFTKVYRTDFFDNQWHPFMRKQKVKIPITDKLDPVSVLVDDADFAKWSDEGLPLDRMSIENATIMTSCARWPLIIDPQLQGIAWIKRRYASNIRLVRLDKKGYLDSIEAGLEQGNTVVLESIGETIDPVLAPVLGRETIKKGKYIKIGDKEVSYHPNFKLILQTNLANPHYQPELQAQCTLINFTVTREGLEDQLLAKVVNAERPDLEELKAELTSQQNHFVVTLKGLEDSLLSRLSSASGNFLGDTALVENLEFTKKTAAEIEQKVAEAKITEVKINEAREFYRPIAIRAALLYFILNELNCCHPIYQFSLKSFNVVFTRAINLSEQSDELAVRINNLIDTTTLCVYQYTARGLFERDKLTFTAKIAFEILLTAGEISRAEYNHLLVFPVRMEGNSPVPFLSNLCWGGICALSELDEFRGLDKDIEGSAKRWKKFSDSEVPEKEKFPPEWKGKNSLQKLMIMRALRPDRMTYAVTLFVEEQLGRVYVENRSIEFAKSFEESGPETPMFFVLSPGVDPLKDVEALGRKLGWHTDRKNFHNVSLGQGQEVVAEAAIDLSAKRGHWVILQNVHLVAKWLATLEKKVEQKSVGSHRNYRLFISAEPASTRAAHILPQGILDCSIKITNEPPTGMQANLHKALDNFNEDTMEMCSREIEFKSILQSLCYFHAVLMERKKFGAQGWNRPYPFNVGDLTICVDVLYNYLETATKVPWDDLRYLFCEIMYGGHITDDWDRKLCKTYLEIFMHPDQLDGELLLAPNYPVPPNLDYKGYHAYIDDNLPPENPSLYGLHPNAEIGVLTTMSNYLFESILDLEPKDSGGGGDGENTREELVKQFIDEAFERLPGEFKIAEMLQKCQDRTPFIIVAFQECERMNFLTSEMTRSLHELRLGMKGELTVTAAMEELEEGIFFDKVPENWSNLAYPSSAGLSVWFADLLCRIRELENWTAEFALPNSVWLGGLFNPQSFLTAIMQAIARKNEWPLDKMCLQCDPTKKMTREEITAPPREGAYIHGLFMEGARWDIQTTSIAESRPKEMMPPVPILFIRAIPVDRLDMKNVYECPVYKTKIRGPTFVWTFNLKTKERASKWIIAGVALLLQD